MKSSRYVAYLEGLGRKGCRYVAYAKGLAGHVRCPRPLITNPIYGAFHKFLEESFDLIKVVAAYVFIGFQFRVCFDIFI